MRRRELQTASKCSPSNDSSKADPKFFTSWVNGGMLYPSGKAYDRRGPPGGRSPGRTSWRFSCTQRVRSRPGPQREGTAVVREILDAPGTRMAPSWSESRVQRAARPRHHGCRLPASATITTFTVAVVVESTSRSDSTARRTVISTRRRRSAGSLTGPRDRRIRTDLYTRRGTRSLCPVPTTSWTGTSGSAALSPLAPAALPSTSPPRAVSRDDRGGGGRPR